MADNPRLEAALGYACLGWKVFPCHSWVDGRCTCGAPACGSPAKHPRTEHGFKDATDDLDVIKGWWQRWPDANVALASGAESGIVVLDVDPRNGGIISLEDLTSEYGPLPDTVESITGSGGRHILFEHPGEAVKCGAGSLGSGLDIKADRGYIIAPPSTHASGQIYEWEATSDPYVKGLAPIPEWLSNLLHVYDQHEPGDLDNYAGDRPGDYYNREATRESVRALLRKHGAKLVGHDVTSGADYICRPRKNGGTSATLGYLPGHRLSVFTTNWPPFEARKHYTPFDAFVMLEHGG